MGTINGAVRDIGREGISRTITWETLTTTNPTGVAAEWCEYDKRCVSITGTFGGATVTLQGSNDDTNYFTLTDQQTVAISKTAAALEQVNELPRFVKPVVTGGDGTTDIDVIITMLRSPWRTGS